MFRPHTDTLNKQMSRKHCKSNGIFFTPKSIRTELCSYLPRDISKSHILEPSFGSGEFIMDLSEEAASITGVELDPVLYQSVHTILDKTNVQLYNQDFLEFETDRLFDIIIGNPPYAQIKDCKKKYRQTYPELEGKFDLYILFILKSLKLLAPGGLLLFVVPGTFTSTSSYDKIRTKLQKQFSIEQVIEFEASGWVGTKQRTIGLVVRRPCSFTIQLSPKLTILSSRNEIAEIRDILSRSNGTIKERGFKVRIGERVWSTVESKALLREEPSQSILLHNGHLTTEHTINLEATSKKPLYIDTVADVIQEPTILMNRGNGNNGHYQFKFAMVLPEQGNFIAENHLCKITGDNLEALFESLKNPLTNQFIARVTMNGSMTSELLYSIPTFFS